MGDGDTLPRPARALLCVRLLNQVGAFAMAFLAVLAGPHLVTAVLTVFGVAALVSRWVGALLLDRATPRTLVATGLALTGVAMLGLAVARTPAQVLVAVAATGLAYEIYEPATSELLARVTTGRQRADTYALLGSVLAAGGAVSGLVAAVLLPFGVRWLLVTDAGTCLAAAALTLRSLPASPARTERARRVRWRPPGGLLWLTLAATAFAFGYLAVVMYLPLTLLSRGAPRWLPGVVLAAAALLAPVGAYLARRTPAACSRSLVLGVGSAVLGGFALLMAFSPDLLLTTSAYAGWTMAMGGLLGLWTALAAQDAPDADRPRWFAFLGLSWGVAQPIMPGIVDLVAGPADGIPAASMLTAGVAFLAVPVVMRLSARPRKSGGPALVS